MRRALLLVLLATTIAHAEPRRVLIADGDAELVHAIETSLAPWKLRVIADGEKPVDPALLSARASEADAQFIVWREGSELVVYDRERGVVERRPARAGAMDPVAAASAALTVKTMMRLPDPAPETTPAETTPPIGVVATPAVVEADRLRVQASIGIDTEPGLRPALGIAWRPTRIPLRIGVLGDYSRVSIEKASSFEGDRSTLRALVTASWPFAVGRYEIEPIVAGGIARLVLDGTEGQDARREDDIMPAFHVGARGWWFAGAWGFGLGAGADINVGTPTYTKTTGMAVIYEVPSVVGTISLSMTWRR